MVLKRGTQRRKVNLSICIPLTTGVLVTNRPPNFYRCAAHFQQLLRQCYYGARRNDAPQGVRQRAAGCGGVRKGRSSAPALLRCTFPACTAIIYHKVTYHYYRPAPEISFNLSFR